MEAGLCDMGFINAIIHGVTSNMVLGPSETGLCAFLVGSICFMV